MTKRQIFKIFTNSSGKELNTKDNKRTYVKNGVMTTVIKRCRGKKTRGIRAIDGFRNKLMILKCPELEAKSKIGKSFKKYNPLEEYSVTIYEIDSYIYKHIKKKKKNTS